MQMQRETRMFKLLSRMAKPTQPERASSTITTWSADGRRPSDDRQPSTSRWEKKRPVGLDDGPDQTTIDLVDQASVNRVRIFALEKAHFLSFPSFLLKSSYFLSLSPSLMHGKATTIEASAANPDMVRLE